MIFLNWLTGSLELANLSCLVILLLQSFPKEASFPFPPDNRHLLCLHSGASGYKHSLVNPDRDLGNRFLMTNHILQEQKQQELASWNKGCRETTNSRKVAKMWHLASFLTLCRGVTHPSYPSGKNTQDSRHNSSPVRHTTHYRATTRPGTHTGKHNWAGRFHD